MYESVKMHDLIRYLVPCFSFVCKLFAQNLKKTETNVMLRSNANNADPDQRPLQSAISEPELHYLH